MIDNKIAVLVVDDETLVRMNLTAHLEDAGMLVVGAQNAADALAVIENTPEIDALLTDIKMPGDIDGLELARLVQRRWPSIGLLLTSGGGSVPIDELPPGSRYFAKPYEARQVIAMVRDRAGR